MKKLVLFIFILSFCGKIQSQTFQQFLSYLNNLPQAERQAKTDSFLNVHVRLPYTESDTLCHFIYKGTATDVQVAGDFTEWNPGLALISIQGTDFWYYSTHCESDARLDYKLVINGSNWILDPKNPYTCTGGYGTNSELRMPACEVHPETEYYPDIPHGIIKDTTFFSKTLNNSRSVRIYLPSGYGNAKRDYPVILFHDGIEYISLAKANNILDYLIAHRVIEPVIGIFVAPVNRQEEYNGILKDQFTSFIVDELMPVMDQQYRTSKNPQKRAVLGASSGGNISLYIGMKHPEIFGKIAVQSSSVETIISDTYRNSAKMDLELFLDIGSYDFPVLITMVESLVKILQDKQYTYQFRTWHEGHSWGNWRDHLNQPLKQFFPFGDGLNKKQINEDAGRGISIPH